MYNFAGIRFRVADANIDSTECKQKLFSILSEAIESDLLDSIFSADLQKSRFTNSIFPEVYIANFTITIKVHY